MRYSYMCYVVVQTMYKCWVATVKWTTVQYDSMLQLFHSGNCYDALYVHFFDTLNKNDEATKQGCHR